MMPRHLLIGVVVLLALALVMGIYVGRVRRSAGIETAADKAPVPPPASGPTEQVTLWVAYDDSGSLRAQSAKIPLPAGRQERAQELLRALLAIYLDKASPHPLGDGSEVRDVYLVDPGVAVIDTNSAFADRHRSGVLIEELTVASIVQTLSTNIPGIVRVKILVDGKERQTLAGHADLSNFYEVSAINQMLNQLQSSPQP